MATLCAHRLVSWIEQPGWFSRMIGDRGTLVHVGVRSKPGAPIDRSLKLTTRYFAQGDEVPSPEQAIRDALPLIQAIAVHGFRRAAGQG
jgi:hypothetical protein